MDLVLTGSVKKDQEKKISKTAHADTCEMWTRYLQENVSENFVNTVNVFKLKKETA